MYTLEGTVLTQSSLKFVRMFIPLKSRSSLNWVMLGDLVGKKLIYTLEGTVLIESS